MSAEADDDIEQPESLRGCPLASISELPHAHAPRPSKTPAAGTGGARPMSAVSVASSVVSHSTHGSQAAASIARTSRRGTGSPPRPRPGSQLWDGNLAAGLELGPQPPDVVLYAIIKVRCGWGGHRTVFVLCVHVCGGCDGALCGVLCVLRLVCGRRVGSDLPCVVLIGGGEGLRRAEYCVVGCGVRRKGVQGAHATPVYLLPLATLSHEHTTRG